MLTTNAEIIAALDAYHVDMMYVMINIAYYKLRKHIDQLTPADYKRELIEYANEHGQNGDTVFADEILAIANRIRS